MKARGLGKVNAAHRAVVDAALALSEGKVGFLEGIRRLVELGRAISQLNDDPDLMTLVGIESEMTHLPDADVRKLCAPAWLDRCDREERDVEAFYSERVRSACALIVSRLGFWQ